MNPSSLLISEYSLLMGLRELSISLKKNEIELERAIETSTRKKNPEGESDDILERKKCLRNDCMNILLLYLSLLYGISWEVIRTLKYDDIINLILGVGLKNIKPPISLPHFMGLPSIVLRSIGINQPEKNHFIFNMCFKNRKYKFHFGLFEINNKYNKNHDDDDFNIYNDNDIHDKDKMLSNTTFPPYGYYDDDDCDDNEDDRKPVFNLPFETLIKNYYSQQKGKSFCPLFLIKEHFLGKNCIDDEEFPVTDEQMMLGAKYFRSLLQDFEYLVISPFNRLITIKKIEDNVYRINNLGDLALLAIKTYKKHFDFNLKEICFTEDELPHFRNLVKKLILKDYLIRDGFKLSGDDDINSLNGQDEKKKCIDFQDTTKYLIDILRITSLHFVLKCASNISPEYHNERFFDEIIDDIKENYSDLKQFQNIITDSEEFVENQFCEYNKQFHYVLDFCGKFFEKSEMFNIENSPFYID